MNKRFRLLLTWSHRWAGLTVGLALIFLATTGAAQAFRPQLEPVLYAGLMGAPVCAPLPLDALVTAAKETHPGRVESVRFHPGGGAAAAIRFADRDIVYVNPCSGAVQGEQAVYGGVFGSLEYVHRLMVFDDFRPVAGAITLAAFLLLVIGGVALWWPHSWRAARRSLKIDGRLSGTAYLVNLHRTVGLYACLVLAAISLVGVAMSFDWAKRAVYWAAGSPLPAGSLPAGETGPVKMLPLEELWRGAAPLLADPRDVTLRLPHRSGEPVQIIAVEASAPHPRARSEMVVDARTGEVRRFTPYSQSSLGSRIYNWGVAIHTGQAGGWLGSLIVFSASMAVPVLGYSGIASWLRRRRSRKALSRAPS